MHTYWKLTIWFTVLSIAAGVLVNLHHYGPAVTTALFAIRHGIASIKYSQAT
jgi:hypothetical protein